MMGHISWNFNTTCVQEQSKTRTNIQKKHDPRKKKSRIFIFFDELKHFHTLDTLQQINEDQCQAVNYLLDTIIN